MANKLYNSHSFMFPILRYSTGQVYPEYKLSFTFWNDSPVNKDIKIDDWVTWTHWCSHEIAPHRSIPHEEMYLQYNQPYDNLSYMKCGRTFRRGFPFKKCHELNTTKATREEEIIFDNEIWTYGIMDYRARVTGLKCEDVIIGELNGYPYRQYKFTAEGYAQWIPCGEAGKDDADWPKAPPQIIEYSADAAVLDNGDILFSASVHAVNPDENQTLGKEEPVFIVGDEGKNPIGEAISIPNIPIPLTCTGYKLWKENDSFKKPYWNIVYQCSGIFPASWSDELPSETLSELSYGLNGESLRSVSGGIVTVKRSVNPTGRKRITAYSVTQEPVCSLGSEYQGGAVMSDIPHKETKMYWKDTGRWNHNTHEPIFELDELTFYRHEVEVLF